MIESMVARPVACIPDAIPEERREAHGALTAQLAGEVMEVDGEPGAIVLWFAAEAPGAVEAFAADERRCCPFLDFEVIATPRARGTVGLRISGSDEGLHVFGKIFDGSRGTE